MKTFLETIKFDDAKEMLNYIKYNTSDLVNNNFKEGSFYLSPLMIAARDGKLDCLIELIKKGAKLNSQKESGLSALMLASYNNNPMCVQKLIEVGADLYLKNNADMTALDLAREAKGAQCIELLENAMKPKVKNTLAEYSKIDLLRALIEKELNGFDIMCIVNINEDTKYSNCKSEMILTIGLC